MTERFRETWRGRVISSYGYSVEVLGRTGIEYRLRNVRLRIDSEVMVAPSREIVVYVGRIPLEGAERDEVVSRVARALAFAGWVVVMDPDN